MAWSYLYIAAKSLLKDQIILLINLVSSLESMVCLYFSWIKPTVETSDNPLPSVDVKLIC